MTKNFVQIIAVITAVTSASFLNAAYAQDGAPADIAALQGHMDEMIAEVGFDLDIATNQSIDTLVQNLSFDSFMPPQLAALDSIQETGETEQVAGSASDLCFAFAD